MENNNSKCSSCGNVIEENDFVTFNLKGEEMCESCESNAWEYSNTVIVTQHGDIETYRWSQEFGFKDADYWEEAELKSLKGYEYIRTDGWRGYWAPIINEGYTTLASGWCTGKWADVSWKHGFNDLVENIQTGKIECPYELVFAFGLTSNVFSVSSDVIIREKDVDDFTQWLLEEAGLSVEELQETLN